MSDEHPPGEEKKSGGELLCSLLKKVSVPPAADSLTADRCATLTKVVVDVETLGLDTLRDEEVVQLAAAALTGDGEFNQYVMTLKDFYPESSEVTKLKLQLLHKGQPVETKDTAAAITAFLDFLQTLSKDPVILIAFNENDLDLFAILGMIDLRYSYADATGTRFKSTVAGMIDAGKLLRNKHSPAQDRPTRYGAKKLQDYLNDKTSYLPDNALEDARALKELLSGVTPEELSAHSYTTEYLINMFQFEVRREKNHQSSYLEFWRDLFRHIWPKLYKTTRLTLASSGLTAEDLCAVYSKEGKQALVETLMAIKDLNQQGIKNRELDNICKFYERNKEKPQPETITPLKRRKEIPEEQRVAATDCEKLLKVALDLEMTGLDDNSDVIVQIACVIVDGNDAEFNQYVLPGKQVSSDAERRTKLRFQMTHKDTPVKACQITSALDRFYKFLEDQKRGPVLLICYEGHNSDASFLSKFVNQVQSDARFKKTVAGMLDFAKLYRERNPGAPNPSLQNLLKNRKPDYVYEPHNALEDARALRMAFSEETPALTPEELSKHSFNADHILSLRPISA